MDEPKTRGGRRPGAGRPPKPDRRVMIALRLPVDLVERLRLELDQTQLIEDLLRRHFEAPQ